MSRLPFELLLALRYLRPKRTFVSIITLISILGVTLGVAVLIIVISVMSGFDQQLRDRILGFNADLKIYAYNTNIDDQMLMTNYAMVMQQVLSNKNVRAVAPFVLGQVMVRTEPEPPREGRIAGPYLRGIAPEMETNVSDLASNIVSGTNDLRGHGLLVGVDFAGELNLHVGDRLVIYNPRDLERMLHEYERGKTNQEVTVAPDFTIRGIFDAGWYQYNSEVIVSSLENAQDLYGLDDAVHGLMVKTRDPYNVTGVRSELARTLGSGFKITTWNEENPTMLAVMVEKNVMLYILFFIVIVAAFGITCTLITFVVLKTREIGVLKALGASSRQILWIFLSQSMVVSVLGVLIGSGAGMLALAYRNEFLHAMRRFTGLELFPASIYGFSELPALIVPGDILIICGGSLIICLVAAAFPAWNASRLRPVEALRHE